ncbi:[NiFe]-hydrogenase assembly chaperone HybE [Paraburkholderia sp. J94]|uniref:[NiFe]-hydrogenase assembly chaperone HybE n=1 Tax=Paraburkholderia sp. J94 TaxID=2805441 RepID=UPI002AB2E51B|nr:[NiFe]-hydrogenase assembly chaperone HybE [Paraburkholderia sp. J94]
MNAPDVVRGASHDRAHTQARDLAAAPAAAPTAAPAADPARDPSRRVEAAFTQIAATRMRDLPYLNPRLAVAAVGFREWQASWIGVLVTPWGINLLQLPTDDAPFAAWRAADAIEVTLPGATLAFVPARLDTLGDYRQCSLFSPAQQFADQASALATAHEVLRLLFEPDASTGATTNSTKNATPDATPAPLADPRRRRLFGLRP